MTGHRPSRGERFRSCSSVLSLASLGTTLVLVGCGPSVPAQCPEGTNPDELGHCVQLEPELLQLVEEVDEGCEEPPAPAPPYEGCTATYDGDPHFETEAEMAEFCASYDCARGGVTIGGTEKLVPGQGNSEITSLDALACLRSSRFFMVSWTEQLTELRLPNYEQSDGGFTVMRNEQLESLELPSLWSVGGDFSIHANPVLGTLELPSLEQVGGYFLVRDNQALPTSLVWDLREQMCPKAVGGATTIVGNGPS